MFNLVSRKSKNGGVTNQDRLSDYDWQPLAQLKNEFDSLVNRLWKEGWMFGDSPTFGQGDFEDLEKEYLVRVVAPGFEVEDFDIQLSGNNLIIRAEHKEENEQNESRSYSYGKLYRTIPLPGHVNEDKIDARYRSGILELNLPKSGDAKAKRISVKDK